MPLLMPSNCELARETLPLLQERSFSVRLRCVCCDRERSQIVRLADEPNDPATVQEFYEGGGMKEIDPDCIYCGETGAVILGVVYLRQPGDERPASIG
ncbi:hypothetical protein ABIE45_004569 [Methylobacterium sp. OAE515]|uniref:hypothetical protein n=1 Tax=Methylobacterium sp. OAE515 TaxID=2817895 RepID=UPI00178A4AF7